MTDIENRLRDAYGAATSTVRPEAMRPLAARPARRARSPWLTPVAVAATVALIVTGTVLLTTREERTGLSAPAPAYAVALIDEGNGHPSHAVVLDTRSGREVAAVPGTYADGSVAAAGDTGTFFLTRREGDCATRVYRIRVRGDGSVSRPEALPGAPLTGAAPSGDLGDWTQLAATPDGRRLAFGGVCGASGRLVVIDVDTGRQRVWTVGTGAPDGRDPRQPVWAPDGRTIGFRYEQAPNRDIRSIDADQAGTGRLLTDSRLLRPQNMSKELKDRRFNHGAIDAFAFNPDGTLTALVQRSSDRSFEGQSGLLRLTAAGAPIGRATWLPDLAISGLLRIDPSGEHFLTIENGRISRMERGRFSWLSGKRSYYDVAW
ncbi:hypothetical protein NE236_33625 [Actinoallomurus purpureus]|uniref:TolB family protein n=1 Tax=Actinoallomurus purpureus TaxID=478114 RepID=UPI0020933F50|nr:hypothetical protein [Actinoallomurus purpureus]MCO6009924.1 hypothetical protein [Actinoallomurus purpureus]